MHWVEANGVHSDEHLIGAVERRQGVVVDELVTLAWGSQEKSTLKGRGMDGAGRVGGVNGLHDIVAVGVRVTRVGQLFGERGAGHEAEGGPIRV